MGSPNSASIPDRRLVALARTLKVLREADDPEQLVQAVLDNLQREFNRELLWLGRYDRVEHCLHRQGHRLGPQISAQGNRLLETSRTLTLTPGDLLEQVVIQQRSLVVNDLRAEPRSGALTLLAERLGIQGTLLFPVRHRDVCHGVLLMGSHQWGQSPKQTDLTYLATVLGTLAAALERHDSQEQAAATQPPEAATVSLLGQINPLAALDDQLEAILQATQTFIGPYRTRIFWFEPQTFSLWERLSVQTGKGNRCRRYDRDTTPLVLPSETIRTVYTTLMASGLIAVGETEGLLVKNLPELFMRTLQGRSLMAAPLLRQGELQGILTTEDREPRLWGPGEKDFLTTASRLGSMVVAASAPPPNLSQQEADQQFLTGLVRSIHHEGDWRQTLETCGQKICDRLNVQQFLVLLQHPDQNGYDLIFQGGKIGRKSSPPRWDSLQSVDEQMLLNSTTAISLPDISEELKLLPWRDNFLSLGIRSLMVCNTSPGHLPEALIIAAGSAPRYWAADEAGFLQAVGHPLGLMLHQWQLQRQADQQERLYASIQGSLQGLHHTFDLQQLEATACRHLVELLNVRFGAMVHWDPGADRAQVGAVIAQHKDFAADTTHGIPIATDAALHWALQTEDMVTVTREDFPEETLAWLSAPPGSQFLLLALRTAPAHQPTAVLILADRAQRTWSDYHRGILTLLGGQLAWSRRHLSLMVKLQTTQRELEKLNWYKHKHLDEIHRRLETNLRQLGDDPSTANPTTLKQRHQFLARQLKGISQTIVGLLEQEQWQLHPHQQTTPLASLLNRLMDRVGPLIRARQLWSKVHNDYSNLIIGGDVVKIEWVLYELLAAACQRSPDQGRIDIWCRLDNPQQLEISITDDGTLSAQLLQDLHLEQRVDALFPSTLDTPPGLHFVICQAIMAQMDKECSFHHLEDDRMMSRVTLPVVER